MNWRYEGPATVRAENVEARIQCSLEVRQTADGRRPWRGTYWNPEPLDALFDVHDAEIELQDGRKGKILLSFTRVSNQDVGTFTGNGAPPD